jgi:polyisoprenoid-binding protein YceI
MVPGLRVASAGPPAKSVGRFLVLGAGLGVIAVALAAGLYAATTFISPDATPREETRIESAETSESAVVSEPEIAPETETAAPGPATSGPSTWRVDPSGSAINFAFSFDDGGGEPTRFEGRFSSWRADIRFDPGNLEASSAVVTIQTGSAAVGVQIHDNALPTAPWFDAGGHPTATFRTTRIRRDGDGYVARGDLTIKGRTRSVDLPFTLTIDGSRARMNGAVTIDRRDFGIGNDTEADDMISREVRISVRVEAVRQS